MSKKAPTWKLNAADGLRPEQIVQSIIDQAQDTAAHGSISSSGLWDFAGVNYAGKQYGSYILHSWGGQLLFDAIVNGAHTVRPIATATPPQEYDLPLAAGLSNDNQYARSVYWRDQFGVVTFFFQVIKSGTSADIGNGERLAILPAGFRPKALANFAAHFEDIGNFAPALGVVHQDGSIVAYNGSGASGRKVFGFGSFVAETL